MPRPSVCNTHAQDALANGSVEWGASDGGRCDVSVSSRANKAAKPAAGISGADEGWLPKSPLKSPLKCPLKNPLTRLSKLSTTEAHAQPLIRRARVGCGCCGWCCGAAVAVPMRPMGSGADREGATLVDRPAFLATRVWLQNVQNVNSFDIVDWLGTASAHTH